MRTGKALVSYSGEAYSLPAHWKVAVEVMAYVEADSSIRATPVELSPDFDVVFFEFLDRHLEPLEFEHDAEVTALFLLGRHPHRY